MHDLESGHNYIRPGYGYGLTWLWLLVVHDLQSGHNCIRPDWLRDYQRRPVVKGRGRAAASSVLPPYRRAAYIVMGLHGYGLIQVWPYIVMAFQCASIISSSCLYSYGHIVMTLYSLCLIELWPPSVLPPYRRAWSSLPTCRAISVSLAIGMALHSYGVT